MQAQLQRVEVEAACRGDDDLAVNDASRRQGMRERGTELGKVAVQRAEIATLDVDTRLAAKDDGPEPVPLGFKRHGTLRRQVFGDGGEHRFDRWWQGRAIE